MKKEYLPYYIPLILAVVAFIVGSFFDYQINDAVFSKNNTGGLVISVIGTIPGYGVLAFLGGGFFYLALNNKIPNHIAWKIIHYLFAALTFGCSVFFAGREFFGPNGFYWLGINRWWGLLIVLPLYVLVAYFGYRLTSKSDNDKLWLIYIIIAGLILLSLVAGVTAIKSIFHRPRFRSLGSVAGMDYHNWWERCKEYKELIKSDVTHTLISEEFKSFPSGHAGTCAVFMMSSLFLPYINKNYKKASIITFSIGFAWLLLVSFARMWVGAHYLSDVSMGTLLVVVCYFIAKIVIDNIKYFSNEEAQQLA